MCVIFELESTRGVQVDAVIGFIFVTVFIIAGHSRTAREFVTKHIVNALRETIARIFARTPIAFCIGYLTRARAVTLQNATRIKRTDKRVGIPNAVAVSERCCLRLTCDILARMRVSVCLRTQRFRYAPTQNDNFQLKINKNDRRVAAAAAATHSEYRVSPRASSLCTNKSWLRVRLPFTHVTLND